MSSSNSRNCTLMIILGIVLIVTFTYVVIYNSNNNIKNDVNGVEIND